MIRDCRLAGVVFAAVLATAIPARADVFVDPPSLGRIVYGMSGGAVVLPADAWYGSYPDASGPDATPDDSGFAGGAIGSGAGMRYAGDTFGTPGANTGYTYAYVTGTLGQAVNVAPVSGAISSGPFSEAGTLSVKLGYISLYGPEAEVYAYHETGAKPAAGDLELLLATHTPAGTTSAVTIDNPFGLAYVSAGTTTVPAYDYYSTDPARNSGYPANTLYDHFKLYKVVSPVLGAGDFYFAGLEDWNFDPSASYHRFDWNDTVLMMEVIPEPAFYQFAVLLVLGAFGVTRLRRARVMAPTRARRER